MQQQATISDAKEGVKPTIDAIAAELGLSPRVLSENFTRGCPRWPIAAIVAWREKHIKPNGLTEQSMQEAVDKWLADVVDLNHASLACGELLAEVRSAFDRANWQISEAVPAETRPLLSRIFTNLNDAIDHKFRRFMQVGLKWTREGYGSTLPDSELDEAWNDLTATDAVLDEGLQPLKLKVASVAPSEYREAIGRAIEAGIGEIRSRIEIVKREIQNTNKEPTQCQPQ